MAGWLVASSGRLRADCASHGTYDDRLLKNFPPLARARSHRSAQSVRAAGHDMSWAGWPARSAGSAGSAEAIATQGMLLSGAESSGGNLYA
ncbi:unnamed protein product (plasmid) [Mycetohabitans rhizoxinica HKI 454]|uniref:Uncharacterized protein n=1 Tax=Mycetohabitans rhizoxinica (strain DSM 19002 / CIP 109453 / HKI 454) TaxID=882378 RepID=E5AW18_MYCRK|nr:unnamed protein product [Mycetohabitans rhizoxinica HKI 454]